MPNMLAHHYSNHHHHHLYHHQHHSPPPHQQTFSPSYLDQHHHSPTIPETYSLPLPPITSEDSPYIQFAETTLESTPDPEYPEVSQSTQDYYYMPTTPSYNPPIRVFQSTSDQSDLQSSAPLSTLNESDSVQQSWSSFANADLRPSTRQQHFRFPLKQTSHKRNSSESTVGSVGPHSPHTPTSLYPRIVDSDSSPYPSPNFENFDSVQYPGTSFSKPLPASSHLPFQNSFLAPALHDYSPLTYNAEAYMAAHTAMTEVVMAQQNSDMTGGDVSAPRSSYNGDDYDENYKASMESRNIIPKLDRTMSEICQDELYNPNISASTSTSQSRPSQSSMLSPYRGVFSERLQAANNSHISGRSGSPVQRERSPFREGSEFSAGEYLNSDQRVSRLGTASHLREQQKDRAVAMVLAQHQNKTSHLAAPNTISPKETHLDYQETEDDARMPLFPQDKPRIHSKESRPSRLNLSKEMSSQGESDADMAEGTHNNMISSRRQSSSDYSMRTGAALSRSNFNFVPPAIAGQVSIPQQYPFISQSRSQSVSSRIISDQLPEFPAHLTSMDTTKSDSGTKSDNGQSESSPDISRPTNTTADSGTYTCTYHGCTQRFATPIKLQKHKREGHRQSTPQTTPQRSIASVASPSGSSSNLANRNSQAGPHRCDRINPSTNKPCNSLFSRPYDLTRHEDTIHNARKQKVRCHLCTEEKTFSRNDALTRHMRVVHPEVDFPGKSKRKGGS